ncbi:MAG: GIY-YIG nuclease family protein [Desulfobacteraceae bacterium]|nr:GIY-YIG nuclease family protein [Desulfobacteraceae bacterium]
MSWFVYIVRCADGSFYTGIATDLDRRVREHNEDDRLGARYTRGRRPVRLAYAEPAASRAAAARREHAIRKLRRQEKERLAAGWRPA